jgi:hypothetical protein
MNAVTLRRWCYRLSALLGLAYAAYVVATKFMPGASRGPLGELGEFLLVLASVTLLSVGLFADETVRGRDGPRPEA